VRHGTAVSPLTGQALDEVLCFFAPGPATATGEDVAEIQGHGGPLVLRTLLEAALEAGARPAEPGEFTRRAYTNGRLDLAQAEAVMSLIGARSRRAARTALRQLAGEAGAGLRGDLEALTAIAARLEAGLDFPDEDLPAVAMGEMAGAIGGISRRLAASGRTFRLGSRLERGAVVALCGPANAGKSSLLNRLVGEQRAIVDPDPGTTRDVVEAAGEIDGVPVLYLDTAGMRESVHPVELRGMERSVRAAAGADVLLLVLDGADPTAEPAGIEALLESADRESVIVAVNKKDLPLWRDSSVDAVRVGISAITGEGLEPLKAAIASALGADAGEDELVLTTARQHAAVDAAARHSALAADRLRAGADPEIAAEDLRLARASLASLWGRDSSDELLDAVFSSFCLGK
jgi:tRNA modification GTPase